jgi:GntR family transcriptional regulator
MLGLLDQFRRSTLTSEQELPLYRDLAAELRRAITAGELPPESRLPTEAELAEEHKVSRNTVRLALAELQAAGLITTGRGRGGRRVQRREMLEFHGSASESMARASERLNFGDGADAWVADNRDQGHEGTQQISVEICEAPPEIARLLEIPASERVIVRRRLRLSDGKPHNLNDTWYPADIAEGSPIAHPADVPQGTIALMKEMGYVQVRYRDEIEGRAPDPTEARRLRIPSGWPVIVQTRTGYTTERPVKVTVTIWPADRARLIYELPA